MNKPDYEQNLAAIRGEQLPDNLSSEEGRTSIIRGIRHHHGFATSAAVTALSAEHAHFARARNARLIMSNIVPEPEEMDGSERERQPYCIWHPDFASETTCRELARRYPSMRYQVGRACAAAGFARLYAELDLLPDVVIAEEARESGTEGGRAIFEAIMASPCRYAVVDDFVLTISDIEKNSALPLGSSSPSPSCPAFLNGDTDVRWKLEDRRALTRVVWSSVLRPRPIPCIEEDMRLGEQEGPRPSEDWPESRYRSHLTPAEVELLYSPLPLDLPTVRKTLLIQMAAYEGNLDRYARLTARLAEAGMDRVELRCVLTTGGIPPHDVRALVGG